MPHTVNQPKPESPPTSPTQTDFLASEIANAHIYDIDKQLQVLRKPESFKINWKALDKHLYDPNNKSRRDIYHQIILDKNVRQEIFNAWKNYS